MSSNKRIFLAPVNDEDDKFRDLALSSVFVVNFYNPDESYLYAEKLGKIKKTTLKSLQKIFDRKQLTRYLDNHQRLAVIHYNPLLGAGPFGTDEDGFTTFNVYQPPPWRRNAYFHGESLPVVTAIPSIVDKYLQHYCDGDRASIEWTLDWAANSLRKKNLTFKTAVGDQGSGKNVFADIMKGVVGASNAVKVRGSEILRNKFNSQLKYKQFVFVNEVSMVEKDEIDKAKDFADKVIEIEAKGEDAVELPNHASFFFASNRKDSVKIDPSDRRFSVIQLTDNNLVNVMNPMEIDKLVSQETADQLGLFLWNRVPTVELRKPFRSARYEQVRAASLSEWETHLIEQVFEKLPVGAEVEVNDLKKKIAEEFPFMKAAPGRNKFEDFTKKYPDQLKFFQKDGRRYIKLLKSLTNVETSEPVTNGNKIS